jgi:hypothetical protein
VVASLNDVYIVLTELRYVLQTLKDTVAPSTDVTSSGRTSRPDGGLDTLLLPTLTSSTKSDCGQSTLFVVVVVVVALVVVVVVAGVVVVALVVVVVVR